MKTLKNSKIVLLFLLIGISVGCKKEDQIKTTITPTSVVYEDTSLNSYVQIDSTTFIGAYGSERKDTWSILPNQKLWDYSWDMYKKNGVYFEYFTTVNKLFTTYWKGKSKNGNTDEDTIIKIEYQCLYTDTNTLEQFKLYQPKEQEFQSTVSTSYYGSEHPYTYDCLIFKIFWGEGKYIMDPRFLRVYNPKYTVSTIKKQLLADGKWHLVLNIYPAKMFDCITGLTATFKARIVLN